IFLLPYVLFVSSNYFRSMLVVPDAEHATTLGRKFIDYLLSAGTFDGKIHAIHLVITGFLVVYNILRFILLFKTKSLEAEERITKQPVNFRLIGGWFWMYEIVHYGMFINLGLVAWHTWNLFHVMVFNPTPK